MSSSTKIVIAKVDIPLAMGLMWGFPIFFVVLVIAILGLKGYSIESMPYLISSGQIRPVPPIVFSISAIAWIALVYRMTAKLAKSDWNILWIEGSYLYDFNGKVAHIDNIDAESLSYGGSLKTGIIIRLHNGFRKIYPRFLMVPRKLLDIKILLNSRK